MGVTLTVFVVDDDQAVRDSLGLLLRAADLEAETFPDARSFLATCTPRRAGCLLLDVRMPGISGLDLQESLAKRGIGLPVIVITGHGDVPMAIRAMKAGAMDFIEKPFGSRALLQRVREALARDARARQQRAQSDAIVARMSQLSPREQEVLDYVVGGQYNKVIATRLGISISTVEAHRKKIMEKLEAESLSDLVRMVASCKERRETAQAQ